MLQLLITYTKKTKTKWCILPVLSLGSILLLEMYFPKTGQFQCHYCWMPKALIMPGTRKSHNSYSSKTKKRKQISWLRDHNRLKEGKTWINQRIKQPWSRCFAIPVLRQELWHQLFLTQISDLADDRIEQFTWKGLSRIIQSNHLTALGLKVKTYYWGLCPNASCTLTCTGHQPPC